MDWSSEDFILIHFINSSPAEPTADGGETLLSTTDMDSWDLPTLLHYRTIKILAHRTRLVECCSYFHGLLCGSFSESNMNGVSIEWNLESFVSVLKCVYCSSSSVDVKSRNFISLLEAAMYFGEETLLLKCKDWISKIVLFMESELDEVNMDDLINFWNFGHENAIDFLPELCAAYLAKNFMFMQSSKCFQDAPFTLLLSGIKHPNLTIDSEKHLSCALLQWLCGFEQFDSSIKVETVCPDILKEIRGFLLPLPFVAGKRRSCYLSELADESTEAIFRLLKVPPEQMMDSWDHAYSGKFRIRLTEYSKKVDLSGCPQITSAILLLSLLPYLYSMDPTSKTRIIEYIVNLERFSKKQSQVPACLLPTLSFGAVEEVDISKCPSLHLEAAIECFSMSFPSLRKIKAAYLLNFKKSTLHKLLEKCPLISEVDLTVDSTPLIPGQVSVLSSSPVISTASTILYARGLDSLYNITSLTLEGRSDICDLDLQHVSKLCVTLLHLNFNGCISVTDVGIANLICRCIQLSSLLVCDTSFSLNSVSALCSATGTLGASSASYHEKRDYPLTSKLQTLHLGGCKGVSESSLLELISQAMALKNLCLRDTHLTDTVLYSFPGFSLETLDVSNTKISGASLVHIVRANPTLSSLNVRGCRNLAEQESIPYPVGALYAELGEKCNLEEISLGWGFSYSAFRALRPGIVSLRSLTIGLGASSSEETLRQLPITCPMLNAIVLHFQVISDDVIVNITTSLRSLQTLALSYCLGDISISSFRLPLPYLTKLRLERVTPWMTQSELTVLARNYPNLVELSLVGCRLLDSDSLRVISRGWPGLISIHLEDCGDVTASDISPLFSCVALEDILLRHNGSGVSKGFILDAAAKLPLLRKVSLDLCDAREGDFDLPGYVDRYFLSSVKIARCSKLRKCCGSLTGSGGIVHRETLVLVWDSERLTRTVIKERL
ncbi:BTB/POZ domain-containing protein FBL11 [Linum perenne]